MEHSSSANYMRGFIPYAAAAFLVGIVGGFASVLGPAFVQDLGIDYNNTTWTALATAMSSAACAPILGKLGDVWGRRATLLLGIGIFAIGNALCALAPSLLFMLAARFVVGIGTAAIAPVILSYIVTQFPPQAAAKGFSLYMLISSASVIAGPTLGGLTVRAYGWRLMMWLCCAIGAAVLVFCLFTLKPQNSPRKPLVDFDWPGAVLVLIFFSLVLCIPSFGQNMGWNSAPFWGVLTAALLALLGLIFFERRAKHPILPGRFLFRRTFLLSVLALFLTQGLLQANMTNIIVFVNDTQPDNSLISAYSISILYLGMSLGSVLVGPLADRMEPKRVLTFSLLLTGVGCALMLLFSNHSPFLLLAGALGILGFGLGGNGTVFLKVALADLSPEAAGAGTGAYGLFRDLAAPFGVAVLVPLFTNAVTAGISAGLGTAEAAVRAIRTLTWTELSCIAAGILVVLLLPSIRPSAGTSRKTG